MKKIFYCVLCLVFIYSLVSCDGVTENFEKEKLIAVKYASANEKASDSYINQGYTKVTYNSTSDVVLAIEKGKAEYGILDDFELNSYMANQGEIKVKEQCEFSIDYCAYFSTGNDALQKSFNKAITHLKSEGVLDEIKNAHFSGESYIENRAICENGTITMLCDPSFKSRVYIDNNGNIVGLDVDVAREICNYLGYDLEIVTAEFDELFKKLQDGEGDFIISSCEVDKERTEYFLSSDAYFTLNYYLVEKE